MKNHGFSLSFTPKAALIFLFALAEILLIAIPQATADNLKPGTYGRAGGWTLSLRADQAPVGSGP